MTGGWGKFRSKDILFFFNELIMTLSVAKIDNRRLSMGNWRNYTVGANKTTQKKTCPSGPSSTTTILTWTSPRRCSGLRGKRPETTRETSHSHIKRFIKFESTSLLVPSDPGRPGTLIYVVTVET